MRVGLAGLQFGASVLIPALKRQTVADIDLIIAGADPEKTKRIADLHSCDYCNGYEDLFSYPLDAVLIALPPNLNIKATSMAISHRIPFWLEKPISDNLAQAREILSINNILNVVDFEFSELVTFNSARELINNKYLGDLKKVIVSWMGESYAYKHNITSWKTGRFGTLLSLGSHLLFLSEWFCGDINNITASQDDKFIHIRARSSNGIPIYLFMSQSTPNIRRHEWNFICENGIIHLINESDDYVSGFKLEMTDQNGSSMIIAEDSLNVDGRIIPITSLLNRFLSSIQSNKPINPNLAHGFQVQKLIEMSIRSLELDRSVRYDEV